MGPLADPAKAPQAIQQGPGVRQRKKIHSAAVVLALFVTSPTAARAAGPESQRPADAGAAALAKGNSADAVSSFTEALKDAGLSNDRRAALLSDRGVAYMRSGQPKLAIDDFNLAAQLFPEHAAVYNNRGNLLVSLGLLKEAVKDFDRALVLAPGYAAAYNNRAGAEMSQGQIADAIRDYSKAVQLMPASPAPFSGRGQAYLVLSKPYAAIRDFTRAVNADARFASGYRNRAEAKLHVEQYDAAIEDLSRAIAFDVNNAEFYVLRGQAYLATKNSAGAIKDFTRAIELDPKLAAAYQSRGLTHGQVEAYDDAYADLNHAIELDPRSAVAFAYRAVIYKQNGQADVGQRDIETAMKLDENRAEVWWAKAELGEALGQPDQAVADLKKALTLRPGYREATEALQRLGGAADQDVEVAALTLDKWKVVARNGRFVATSLEFPNVSVPLETIGQGQPRLLEWEIKKAPFKGIGVLRFHGGVLQSRAGNEEIELSAVIDLEDGKIIAVEPNKQGAKIANWTWEEGKLTVASADGATDEFSLRVGRDAIMASPAAGAGAGEPQTRRYTERQGDYGIWNPFAGQWGGGTTSRAPQRYTAKRKPKTLFDLFFN